MAINQKKCKYCGIKFTVSNPLRVIPPFFLLFPIADLFYKGFCSTECEIEYYSAKGKNPPSVIKKFFIWILSLTLGLIIITIVLGGGYLILTNIK